MPMTHSISCSSVVDKQHVEFICKFCPGRKFRSSVLFMTHLATSHAAIEGGSYTCRYGQNSICIACPAVGISKDDYGEHLARHHINRDKVKFNTDHDLWNVLSSSVNLPAVLNDPEKGKQKDFFTRTWGADFVDSTALPPSPYVCEIPPQSFNKYLRKLKKLNLRHDKTRKAQLFPCEASSSSRESKTSSCPIPPLKSYLTVPASAVQKLNIPDVFLGESFDLTNPSTFNEIFSFLNETLNPKTRVNPFQIESHEAKQVESSGHLLQEKLQHYIDQVEVSIAGQVASKSHHFFEVMTYHDVLMAQILTLISVVKNIREKLAGIEDGVVMALTIPQMAQRKQNLVALLKTLKTMDTLHNTQPTIQILISREEFVGALDLIETSKDILCNETSGIDSLKNLTSQLEQLKDSTEKMLLADIQTVIKTELNRNVETRGAFDIVSESDLDECTLGALVSGLLRLQSFSFLEILEQAGIRAVKEVIKNVVLDKLKLKTDTTVITLVADFAAAANSDEWFAFLDLLGASLFVILKRISQIHKVIGIEIDELTIKVKDDILHAIPSAAIDRLKSTVEEVGVSICDQMHERLGKLLTLRSRPSAIKRVTNSELTRVGNLVSKLVEETRNLFGIKCAGLSLSYQGQTILYVQTVQDLAKEGIIKEMETERWRKSVVSKQEILDLHHVLRGVVELGQVDDISDEINDVTIEGEKYLIVDSVMALLGAVNNYCYMAEHLPKSNVEIGMKTVELLKLFNSRACQLVLGAGAVSTAGLKTITIRNLAVTLRSLNLVAKTLPYIKQHLLVQSPNLTEKQLTTWVRNFESADKDYTEHQGELERKMVQIVDEALSQHIAAWQLKPPVPSTSFQSIGKQMTKFYEAIHDILPHSKISNLFKTIHLTFLTRVSDKLVAEKVAADNSPTYGLVVSELLFYRENLKYLDVVPEEMLANDALAVVWT